MEVPPLGRRGVLKLTDAEAARRVALMNRARRSPAERRAEAVRLAEAATSMPIDVAMRHIAPRARVVASYHLAGWSLRQIADALGYAQPGTVRAVLQRPPVRRFIELVRAEQLERLVAGEFGGVVTQAKAAAPKLVEHLVELGGGQRDRTTGERRGRAKRDSDAIRASEVVLGVAGVQRQVHQHYHMHVLEQMSDHELEEYATNNVWPTRLGPAPCSALGDPPEDTLHDAGPHPTRPRLLTGAGEGRGARARARGGPGRAW